MNYNSEQKSTLQPIISTPENTLYDRLVESPPDILLGRNTRTTTSTSLVPEQPKKILSSDNMSTLLNGTDIEKSAAEADEQEFPDGGYGWVVVICLFWINAHSWGLNIGYSVFLNHFLSSGLYTGVSPIAFAFIGGLSAGISLLVAPLVTLCTLKTNMHVTLYTGTVLTSFGFIAASFDNSHTSIWPLFLARGLCIGLGLGFLFVGSANVIPQWFCKRRNLAAAIACAGSGVGGLTYTLATEVMIEKIGLEWSCRVIGIISFIVNFTCCTFLKNRDKAMGVKYKVFDIKIFRHGIKFFTLLSFAFFSVMGYIIIVFSLPNYSTVQGLTTYQSSVVGSILNLGLALGRPTVGLVSDKYGGFNVAVILLFTSSVFSFLVWTFAKVLGAIIFFALVIGSICGVFWTNILPMTVDIVGFPDLPAGLNMVWLVISIPSIFAEAIAVYIVQASNSYFGVIMFVGVSFIFATVSLLFTRAAYLREKLLSGLPSQTLSSCTSSTFSHSSSLEQHTRSSPNSSKLWHYCFVRQKV